MILTYLSVHNMSSIISNYKYVNHTISDIINNINETIHNIIISYKNVKLLNDVNIMNGIIVECTNRTLNNMLNKIEKHIISKIHNEFNQKFTLTNHVISKDNKHRISITLHKKE